MNRISKSAANVGRHDTEGTMRMPFSPPRHGPVALVAFTLVLLARRADGSESSTASLETVAPSLLDEASIVLTPN